MPPLLTRLRRATGRVVAGGAEPTSAPPTMVVPIMVRAQTSDDADLRLLLEVRVTSALDAQQLERVVLALVVPAVARWVGRLSLDRLQSELTAALPEPAAAVREELAALGVDLLRLDMVAAEHLLASPSGGRAHDPG